MVNIDQFKTKGYIRYQVSHEELNRYIKFSVIAVDNLKNESVSEEALKGKIANLIADAGERWPSTTYDSPFDTIKFVRLRLTQSGIMWVYSAFDVFLNHIEGFCANNQELDDSSSTVETADSLKIMEIFKKYSWDTSELNYLLPLFKFYTLTRHCIVHNTGKATKALKDSSNSKELKDAMDTWPTVSKNRKLSPPPEITEENDILLKPHHAITYSDICLRIAAITNTNVFNTVGLYPFLISVVKNRLLNLLEPIEPLGADLYAYLKISIYKEYKIRNLENNEIRDLLESNQLWEKCREKYRALKKKT